MRRFGAAAAIVAAGLAASSMPAEAQTSYRVMCLAGPGMSAVLSPGGTIQLSFVAGSHAASTAPPDPGMCVWFDRAFGAGEPTTMLVSANVAMASYIANSLLSGAIFYVDIYNNSSGLMIVTRVGL
jgi:hypothetical protein